MESHGYSLPHFGQKAKRTWEIKNFLFKDAFCDSERYAVHGVHRAYTGIVTHMSGVGAGCFALCRARSWASLSLGRFTGWRVRSFVRPELTLVPSEEPDQEDSLVLGELCTFQRPIVGAPPLVVYVEHRVAVSVQDEVHH